MVDDSNPEYFFRDWFAEWGAKPPSFGSATELLVRAIDKDPERAWDLILGLIERAPDAETLNCVGAGPLEDLLSSHGSAFIDRVEVRSRSDEQFQNCLAYVWAFLSIEPSIYDRLCLVAPVRRRPVGGA